MCDQCDECMHHIIVPHTYWEEGYDDCPYWHKMTEEECEEMDNGNCPYFERMDFNDPDGTADALYEAWKEWRDEFDD